MCCFPLRVPGEKSSPKNRRKNGSSNICGVLNETFLGVELMKTFTTLGATFLTTGAKLVVSLVSRLRGLVSTATFGGGPLLSAFAALPWASCVKANASAITAAALLSRVTRTLFRKGLVLSVIT